MAGAPADRRAEIIEGRRLRSLGVVVAAIMFVCVGAAGLAFGQTLLAVLCLPFGLLAGGVVLGTLVRPPRIELTLEGLSYSSWLRPSGWSVRWDEVSNFRPLDIGQRMIAFDLLDAAGGKQQGALVGDFADPEGLAAQLNARATGAMSGAPD